MPVEITILSGQRQGERIELTESAFEVGDRPTDAVCFDAAADPEVQGRRAALRLEDGGWRIRSTGTLPIIVNHDPVERTHALRSGDIVRMSEQGPDFSFAMINRLNPRPITSSSVTELAKATTVPTPATTPTDRERATIAAISTKLSKPAVIAGVAVVCLSLFAFILLRSLGTRETELPTPALAAVPALSAEEDDELVSHPELRNVQEVNQAPMLEPLAPQTQDSLRGDPWEIAADQVRQSLYLVGVHPTDSPSFLPLGTACAIDTETLLTSAAVATGLQEGRQRGWEVVAIKSTQPLDSQARRVLITDLMAHVGWTKSDDPQTQVFFDLGLLKVAEPLETACQLATAESVADLAAEPRPLGCAGFEITGGPLARFDLPSAELNRVELDSVIAFPAASDATVAAPPLLQLSGELPSNLFGSPIVTRDAKIVGVYAARAELPADAELQHLHYAAVVTLVSAWLAGEGLNHWATPEPEPMTTTSNESN